MNNNINYRPEIDGLRALAVLMVVLYHLRLDEFEIYFFRGGFIGVDIFFVISGYLISKIILSELAKENRFNYLLFLERRARRILPMLFFTLIITFGLSWVFYTPSQFIEYSWSAITSLFFSSNIYFYLSSISYDADSSLLKPLLHTWSLSIEEQFYLFFPVALFFLILDKP